MNPATHQLASWTLAARFGETPTERIWITIVVGSHGPTPDDLWPIGYLAPFSEAHSIAWQGQWPLNGWPNILITLALLAWTFRVAIRRGISPVSLCSARLDAEVVATVRRLWDRVGIR